MKLVGGRPPRRHQSDFHRRKAVAPLKHRGLLSLGLLLGNFHRRKAVAPLKLGSIARWHSPRNTNFHRRKAVAPLKPWKRKWLVSFRRLFPPPKGGGPIEATSAQSIPAAPISFPPPKGGGPIEACGYRGAPPASDPDFHRRKAVAPLKREGGCAHE